MATISDFAISIGGVENTLKSMKIVMEDGAYMPIRAHADDAGLDLRSPDSMVVEPFKSVVIDTGIRVEIPRGYYGKLESKSGLHINHDIVCCGGTIDSGYTGTIRVKLYNMGGNKYEIKAGDKIVQLIIIPYIALDLNLVTSLEDTDRGENGFGSSGR